MADQRSAGPRRSASGGGRIGGAFVVQFIHSDTNGQRRPCGRSRVPHLTPPPPPPKQDAAPPLAIAPFAPQHGGSGDDSFKQMLSLLAYMQDRDEKMRASAREEARIAIERLRADNELQMERERVASKERLAQLEVSARSAGRDTLHRDLTQIFSRSASAMPSVRSSKRSTRTTTTSPKSSRTQRLRRNPMRSRRSSKSSSPSRRRRDRSSRSGSSKAARPAWRIRHRRSA